MVNGGVKSQTERMTLGVQAESELPITRRAIQRLRTMLLERLAETDVGARELRESIYLSVRLLRPIEAMLIDLINDGALARSESDIAQHIDRAMQTRTMQ